MHEDQKGHLRYPEQWGFAHLTIKN